MLNVTSVTVIELLNGDMQKKLSVHDMSSIKTVNM